MDNLTERQKFVLTLVIHEYIRTAAPVGSKNLVERYNLDISPATVRNEMAVLTDLGYLRQPHTSAGRIPSEEGYRYFVSRLLHDTELPDPTRRMISHQFYQSRNDVDEWMRLAASILAYQSHGASLVTAPRAEQARVKHIEFISTRGRQVLMVLVLVGGEIRQRIFLADEIIPQERLSASAAYLTDVLQNKTAEAIALIRSQMAEIDRAAAGWVLDELSQDNQYLPGEVYLDGLTNVLAEPEFAAAGGEARRALRLLEERPLLQDLLNRTVMTSSVGIVQVLIGGEGTWDDLRQCSVILARYGSPGLATGTLGVLGPMRMPYGRTISTVRFVANVLGELVGESQNE